LTRQLRGRGMMVWTSPARHLAQGRAVPRWLSLKHI
jgi:hypothetical protein